MLTLFASLMVVGLCSFQCNAAHGVLVGVGHVLDEMHRSMSSTRPRGLLALVRLQPGDSGCVSLCCVMHWFSGADPSPHQQACGESGVKLEQA